MHTTRVIKATNSYTPHVCRGGRVFVDTQTWRILSVATAKRIGDSYTGSRADGIYVVVHVQVTNGKSQSVTLTSDIAKLEVNGDEYSPDSNGLTALEFSGRPILLLKDLGPHVSTRAWFAYDVPKSVLTHHPQVCFHELGFGFSKGCIQLS
jgi:Domain of unknown function (DUF4352)